MPVALGGRCRPHIMSPTSSTSHPKGLPDPSGTGRTTIVAGGEPSFGWDALVPRMAHPLKVAIVEALLWVGQPLSSTDLTKLIGDEQFGLSHVSYHVVTLAEAGAIEERWTRPARGAVETFYFFRSRPTITAEQRDALYDQILDRLSGIGDVWLAVCAENYDAVDRLAQTYADDLRLVLDDLGWGDGPGGPIELSTPPDVLRRVLTRLRDAAVGLDASQQEERAEAQESAQRNRLVVEACRHVLADL